MSRQISSPAGHKLDIYVLDLLNQACDLRASYRLESMNALPERIGTLMASLEECECGVKEMLAAGEIKAEDHVICRYVHGLKTYHCPRCFNGPIYLTEDFGQLDTPDEAEVDEPTCGDCGTPLAEGEEPERGRGVLVGLSPNRQP